MNAFGAGIELEAEALQAADEMVLDVDGAVGGDLGVQLVLVAHTLHQRTGARIDEALRQLLVQRIRKTILDLARLPLPVLGILEPVGRLETNVHVRMCAMRLASVSMSPSVRSASATCLANQSSGMRSSGPIRYP